MVSLTEQDVHIKSLGKTFSFAANELIFTELSKKYSLEEVEKMSNLCGFIFQEHFLDSQKLFVDSLWIKI